MRLDFWKRNLTLVEGLLKSSSLPSTLPPPPQISNFSKFLFLANSCVYLKAKSSQVVSTPV